MPILTPDGKPYRTFSEPNPILVGQETIESKNLVFHNFKWEPKVVEGPPPLTAAPKKKKKKSPTQPAPEKKEKPEGDFLELLRKEAAELRTQKPEPKPEPVPEPEPDDVMDSEGVVIVHCHPAVVREKVDSFYGESRKTIQYGEKTKFEAIILDHNDLEISLFAKTEISKGSVIYPSTYKDGEKLDLFRWWRVTRSKAVKDGFVLYAEITNYQADFSG
jgi:hypothetical protein